MHLLPIYMSVPFSVYSNMIQFRFSMSICLIQHALGSNSLCQKRQSARLHITKHIEKVKWEIKQLTDKTKAGIHKTSKSLLTSCIKY